MGVKKSKIFNLFLVVKVHFLEEKLECFLASLCVTLVDIVNNMVVKQIEHGLKLSLIEGMVIKFDNRGCGRGVHSK